MRAFCVSFWRYWLHQKMGWEVRGSLDAYPQALLVIIGPSDNRLAARVIRIWRRGWKFQDNRDVWALSSEELTEQKLAQKLDAEVSQGSWVVPVGVDLARLKINIHTPFHRSAHPERDAAYLARYFDYHRKRV